jgi:hypothetical protein
VDVDYAAPGPLTALDAVPANAFAGLADDPVGICFPVHDLVVQPTDAAASGLPAARLAENQIRPVGRLVDVLLGMDAAPLVASRPAMSRVVGTCRHFAVIACAVLRFRGIASRVRCGFATYFQPEQALDHWITEYREGDGDRWVRLDPEILGGTVLEHPEDLRPGEFLTGAEAWCAYRRGEVDASRFGVHGTANFGPAEIRGNLVKDLAAINKVEMLPWDEWGRMSKAYAHQTGADYDELLDAVAATLVAEDLAGAAALYRDRPELTVPPHLLR